jgi:hypothetical protein
VVGSVIIGRFALAFEGGSSIKGTGRVGCVWLLMGVWLPPSPNLVKCRPRRHSANPLVKGLHLVNRDLLVRPNHIISHTNSLLWGVLCRQERLSAPPGEGVGLVLLFPNPGDGRGGWGAGPGGGPGVEEEEEEIDLLKSK